jgi:hypothetical protein
MDLKLAWWIFACVFCPKPVFLLPFYNPSAFGKPDTVFPPPVGRSFAGGFHGSGRGGKASR